MSTRPTRELARPHLERGRTAETRGEARNWHHHVDTDSVHWLILDREGESTNTLGVEVLEELDERLRDVESARPPALVIRSGKDNGFAAGADIREFRGMTDAIAVADQVRSGHRVMNRLANLSVPTLALVHGFCLGGGLELALACDYRVARRDCSLGFPEVQLGLHPGLGGTARLPRVIAPQEALKMMLTGKPVSAASARSLGLVDAIGEERHFANAVRMAATGRLESRAGGTGHALLRSTPSRRLIAAQAERTVRKRAPKEHYPAPHALIELWSRHGGSEREALNAEPESFADLLTGEVSRNLVRVYFLREKLKSTGAGVDPAIEHVHVIGAGTMGGDIAAWAAHRGFRVTVEDPEIDMLASTVARAHRLFDHEHDTDHERVAAGDRLIPDTRGSGRSRADLIIEAVPEKPDLKKKIYAEVESVMKPGAILATNTSSILLEDLRDDVRDPSRFLGLHFFNPVAKMLLVEVVRHDGLDDEVRDRATAFAASLGKLPVEVRSSPGFLVNRVLMPYLMETLVLLDEGVPPERLDAAAEAFGMPMGPVTLADQVGLDIALDVADVLRDQLEQPLPAIPGWFREKVEAGRLGVKTGAGLYDYDDDGAAGKDEHAAEMDADERARLQDRLLLPMVNTCVACLREELVADEDIVDGALIFGTGFAPFLGGPLAWARRRGIDEITRELDRLAGEVGERYRPDPGWAGLGK